MRFEISFYLRHLSQNLFLFQLYKLIIAKPSPSYCSPKILYLQYVYNILFLLSCYEFYFIFHLNSKELITIEKNSKCQIPTNQAVKENNICTNNSFLS